MVIRPCDAAPGRRPPLVVLAFRFAGLFGENLYDGSTGLGAGNSSPPASFVLGNRSAQVSTSAPPTGLQRPRERLD